MKDERSSNTIIPMQPISQCDLVGSLAMVMSRQRKHGHHKIQPIVTRHALRSQRAERKYRSLFAEDNAVNQKIACYSNAPIITHLLPDYSQIINLARSLCRVETRVSYASQQCYT